MKTLIVVDMQNDFIDGALGTKEAQAIEYSCAAEPPVRGGVSHLSRRNEPL